MKHIISLLILTLFLISCAPQGNTVSIDGKTFSVEVVEKKEDRARGLMFREQLCESCGMLFIFEEEAGRTFWMKNTLIPLDMIFISADYEVVDIKHAIPCEEDPCLRYHSNGEAQYVLEVNAHTFDASIIGKKVDVSLKA